MTARLPRTATAGVSLAALLLCFGAAFAQAPPALPGPLPAPLPAPLPPSIVLPPLPDVSVRIGPGDEAKSAPGQPAPVAQPHTAPALVPPVVVETSSPPKAAPAPAPVFQNATPAAAPVPPPAAAQNAGGDPALRAALEALVKEPLARPQAAVRQQREVLLAFYAARGFAPLWLADGGWTKAARGAQARLEKSDADGLDVKLPPAADLRGAEAKTLAEAELALSQAVVVYGRQASGGRVNPRSISGLITEKPEVAEADKILNFVASAGDGDAALVSFNPPQAGYRALREKLAELRASRPPEPARIAAGPTLRVGMKDARVPSLRARLSISPDPAAASDELLYDAGVAGAVAAFQRSKGLPSFGQLNAATVDALDSGGPARIQSEIIANMERWRWLPRNTAPDQIEVNIPDYTVKVTRGGVVVHTARVVVGKPDTPTPVFSNRMQFLEVNPYWNVPQSIIKKEMLPRLASDPGYLQRQGYEVTTDRKGQMVVRQPPGNRNALGFIKFMFPNEHAVYLHDTPSRALFSQARRAYSHGCVRVDLPFKFAEIVLGRDNGWTEERVKKLIGTGNRTIPLPKHIDVHIEYFTAFVDADGQLQLRDDIYGYSRRLRAAMGLTG